MLTLSTEDIMLNTQSVAKAYGSGQGAPLLFETFTQNVNTMTLQSLTAIHKEPPLYPMTIKLPKAIRYLKEGDFTPAQIITINEPLHGSDGAPLWYANSSKGVTLRFGYRDGDKRYPSELVFGDAYIHGLLAGATGQGKSVALNNLLYNIAREYAPWEVDLTFCDAKIAEGKTIADTAPIPHITAVAATADTDYIVSVLRRARRSMIERNSYFTLAGAKKIDEFRKITGLAIPQVIIIVDETQAMFENALKNKAASAELISIINDLTKLGRSTGYHLLLASQELGDTIPKSAMNQMSVRCALGCPEAVSNAILGNRGAVEYYNKKGNLVVNTEGGTGTEATNVHYRVPLILQEQQVTVYKECKALCEKLGYKYSFNSYDEEAFIRESKWPAYLRNFTTDKYTILLGEPSFVTEDDEKILKVEFNGKDIENILILSEQQEELLRFCKMLKYSFQRSGGVSHYMAIVNSAFEETCKIQELANSTSDEKSYDNNEILASMKYLVMKRKLAISTDSITFQDATYTKDSDDIFYRAFEHGSEEDTEINRIRCFHALALLQQSKVFANWFSDCLPKSDAESIVATRVRLIRELINLYTTLGSTRTQLQRSKLPPIYVWLLGLERMLGLGRSPKSSMLQDFKATLQDCTEVNIRYLIFARSMEETADLRDAFGYYLMNAVPTGDQSRLKISDEYPAVVRPVQGILYVKSEAQGFKSKKFKKMIFDEETL